eukprot:TRINITY_DN10911_c0_g2_i1.p1 TRINITY_DN10911_c0_g2~~TRINITY_DN10911_c0_g2_i1.p1  ORF type:complete len:383 (+),score=85.92 TRINITY_DN10911_c0_g2_i1:44-1150(+)
MLRSLSILSFALVATAVDSESTRHGSCSEWREEAKKTMRPGKYVPQCEADGVTFSRKQCQGGVQNCWCAHPVTGEKLDSDISTCQACAVKRDAAQKKGFLGSYIPQCEEDGTFKTKQCHGSTGKCWCAEKMTGEHLDVELSACEERTPACGEARVAAFKTSAAFVPECETDGKLWKAKQCSKTGCWCVDVKTGKRAGELNAEGSCTGITMNTPCLEKRNAALEKHTKTGHTGVYIPLCEADGSYSRKQCRGGVQGCWCVDSETGERSADNKCLSSLNKKSTLPESENNSENDSKNDLNVGIAVMAVGTMAAAIAVAAVTYYHLKRRRSLHDSVIAKELGQDMDCISTCDVEDPSDTVKLNLVDHDAVE